MRLAGALWEGVPVSELWARVRAWMGGNATERAAAEEHMSPAERHIASERVEDVAADEAAEERLGGFDPDRLEE